MFTIWMSALKTGKYNSKKPIYVRQEQDVCDGLGKALT